MGWCGGLLWWWCPSACPPILAQWRGSRDEARLLAAYRPSRAAPLYALERLDDRWAIVTGYVDGVELEASIAQGPVSPEAARYIGIEVAVVLAVIWGHAHSETGQPLHVVHRDATAGACRVGGTFFRAT
jgi:hypothetical protein